MLRNTLNTFITATLIMLLGVSSSAQAIVPMGNLMGSTSVTWGDQEETTDSSTLTIALAPAEPTIREHGGLGDREVEGNKVTVTYTITSRANGPDNYTLAAPYDSNAEGNENAGDLTTAIQKADGGAFTNPMSLGATAAIDSTDSTTITVICDAASSTASNCNGIEAGDTVIIGDGDTAYTVAPEGVSNTGEGPSTIRLNDVPVGILLGTRIAEQKTFKVVVSGDALLNSAEQVTFALKVTGTSADENQIGTASLAHTIEGIPIDPSVDRYARNLTDPNGNPDPANVESTQFQNGELVDEGGVNYYKTGVSAEEGDEVEILIVLKAGNQGEQSNITLNESLPPFATYLPGTAKINNQPIDDNEDGTSPLLETNVYASAEGPLFPIPTNNSAHVTYKMKVIGDRPGADSGEEMQDRLADEPAADDDEAEGMPAPPEIDLIPPGTLWSVGQKEARRRVKKGLAGINTACWCDAPRIPADYCKAEGWAVGANQWQTKSDQNDVRRTADWAINGAGIARNSCVDK